MLSSLCTSHRTRASLRGHWRCCRACAGLQLDGTAESKTDTTTRQCEECSQQRPLQYFQESSSMCIACALHADFSIFLCGKCDKPTSLQHWSGRWDEYRQRLCTSCVPEAASLQCYFCKKTQSLQCFALKYPAVETSSMQLIRVVTKWLKHTLTSFVVIDTPQPKYIRRKDSILPTGRSRNDSRFDRVACVLRLQTKAKHSC